MDINIGYEHIHHYTSIFQGLSYEPHGYKPHPCIYDAQWYRKLFSSSFSLKKILHTSRNKKIQTFQETQQDFHHPWHQHPRKSSSRRSLVKREPQVFHCWKTMPRGSSFRWTRTRALDPIGLKFFLGLGMWLKVRTPMFEGDKNSVFLSYFGVKNSSFLCVF